MKIKIAYGKKGLEIEFPENLKFDIIEPKFLQGINNPESEIERSLKSPIGKEPLAKLAAKSKNIGIVFSDISRATPYHIILPQILKEISSVPDNRIFLFNATGTHRINTREELIAILGKEIVDRFTIIQNDANDKNSHVKIGGTSTGNDILIHRDFTACDLKILTGFIEPHFFAGFSGGGKAIMPGLASLDTIMRNHNAHNLDNNNATWGVTRTNPLWEEIFQAASLIDNLFLVNVTMNKFKEITGVFSGDFEKAHEKGCVFVKEYSMIPVNEEYDLVITGNSGYPLDLNLYQSVKGMSAASKITKKGGAIIMAAECWDGIPDYGDFKDILSSGKNYKDILKEIRNSGYQRQDMWQAQIYCSICDTFNVYLYSDFLNDEKVLQQVKMKPCKNIVSLAEEINRKYQNKARMCIMPEGPQTIPYIAKAKASN